MAACLLRRLQVSRLASVSSPSFRSFAAEAVAVKNERPATFTLPKAPRPFSPLMISAKPTDVIQSFHARNQEKIERLKKEVENQHWNFGSRRCGALALKAGMLSDYNHQGKLVPLTLLWIENCQVIQITDTEKPNRVGMMVGIGYKRFNKVEPKISHLCRVAGVPTKRFTSVFPVTSDAVLPLGTEIPAAHYSPGQKVDVKAYTKGKGWQGVMKRWGFHGLGASHGVSGRHRAPGSIGCGRGKVLKGKKMAGRMGHDLILVPSLTVERIDNMRNIVYVVGSVPGPIGTLVHIRDAEFAPPFPHSKPRHFDDAELAEFLKNTKTDPKLPAFPTFFPTGKEAPFFYPVVSAPSSDKSKPQAATGGAKTAKIQKK